MATTGALMGSSPDMTSGELALDILGIGLGPANLSLAIAIEEFNADAPAARRVKARFIERQPRFGWHDGMLLPDATMQVSFLKDLATLRAPTSTYTFLNYLRESGRLSDFINLKTFFPTRREFHGYLTWAAGRLSVPVSYATSATQIDLTASGFEVSMRRGDGEFARCEARNVVVGTGIRPVLPAGVTAGPRVFHNHRLLADLREVPSRNHRRFLVIGSGQSAAEVVAYLHQTYPDAEVHASIRRFGYLPSDDTPYANRIFDPESVDEFFTAPAALRRQMLSDHWSTNYSAVDAELIGDLFRREYDERVRGERRLFVHRITEIGNVEESANEVKVVLHDLGGRHSTSITVDTVVCATGFRSSDLRELLGPTIDQAAVFDHNEPIVERDYSLRLPEITGQLFLNGGVQHSHGLSSSLLSNMAVRAGEILRATADAEGRYRQ